MIDQSEKTLVFCATQEHALAVRDLVNQIKTSSDPDYCVRVTANDGSIGDRMLRQFQDNEKAIPTVLTTSKKLSTGVDARNVRNIVLMRPVKSMVEFKQIIGRGTRLFEGKNFFTVFDFVKAHQHFQDPEWDGEPLEPEITDSPDDRDPPDKDSQGSEVKPRPEKTTVRLADGKSRTIQHMTSTSYWDPDATPMSAEQFLEQLLGKLPELFKDEDELRELWSDPTTRTKLLDDLAEMGYGTERLRDLQRMVDAENSDLYDVLSYIAYTAVPKTRAERAEQAKVVVDHRFHPKQVVFLHFVLSQYVDLGVTELSRDKLAPLLKLKYGDSIQDAIEAVGGPEIGPAFAEFQQYLYKSESA